MENQRALILTQMWMAGESVEAISTRFDISVSTLRKWVQKYKLPTRRYSACEPAYDPSPEEIELMKAELKARHIAERMAEDVSNTQSKVSKWRAGICKPRGAA